MRKNVILLSILAASAASQISVAAESITEALTTGTPSLDINLRYEDVDQDTAEAQALTIRTRLEYTTADYMGFSATVGMEDVSIVGGVNDFKAPPAGMAGPADTAVIADAEVTEIDQSFVQYKQDMVTAKLGRQVIALDNQRFVGHVGWRQDRQTFDAFRVMVTPLKDLTIDLSYIDRRRRIFAENADIDSSDVLVNIGYVTPFGKVVGYSYNLEEEGTATESQFDTLGLSFTGALSLDAVKLLYAIEFASQEFDNNAGASADTEYTKLEGGVSVAGVTAKLGYEVLGSDDGVVAFQTPLATGHAFNGWADIFLATPAQGLVDTYLSVGGAVAGVNLALIYHDFEADEDSATIDDLGDELDFVATKAFGKNYSAGVKYASYQAGDGSYQDTDKFWIWVNAKF